MFWKNEISDYLSQVSKSSLTKHYQNNMQTFSFSKTFKVTKIIDLNKSLSYLILEEKKNFTLF